MFDKNNFTYMLQNKFKVVMHKGKLEINDCEYEDNDDDPTYAFARVVGATIYNAKNGKPK